MSADARAGGGLALAAERVLRPALDWGPWVFSMLQRDPGSPEYGCFDRAFWHYRTEREFPAATFQYLVLALACLHLLPGSPWRGRPELREWARAGCGFWARTQRRDATFDEWLPHERSHVATAFSTAMLTEALLLFREAGEELALGPEVWRALERAGTWLSGHHDRAVLNHTAGAVAALENLFRLTGNPAWRAGRDAALEVLERARTPEGWFPEYGGADLGYGSVSVAFLGRAWARSQDSRLLDALLPCLRFFTGFMGPDGSVGGAHGSRNTRYLLPHGLIALGGLPEARDALALWVQGREAGVGFGLEALDDRYRGFFLVSHLLGLVLLAKNPDLGPYPAVPLPRPDAFLPLAGLARLTRGPFTVLAGLRKHGALEVFGPSGLLHADAGVEIRFADGRRATSQWSDPDARMRFLPEEGRLECGGAFAFLKDPALFRRALLPHRLLSHAAAALGLSPGGINEGIKARFVKPMAAAPARLFRSVRVRPDAVLIRDDLEWDRPAERLVLNQGWGQMHVPSSNFFTQGHMGHAEIDARGRTRLSLLATVRPERVEREILPSAPSDRARKTP